MDLGVLVRGLLDQFFQGEDDVGRGEGPAVVETHVPPEVKGVLAVVGGNLPAFGQFRSQVAQVVGLDQVAENELGDLPVDIDVAFPRDQRPGLGQDECWTGAATVVLGCA